MPSRSLNTSLNQPSVREAAFQDFFSRHRDFIKGSEYKDARPHVYLQRTGHTPLIPDFILEPLGPNGLADVLELKLPSAPVTVTSGKHVGLSASVVRASAQLRDYSDYFEDEQNRLRVRNTYGINVFRPRMFLVIGRRGTVSPLDVRRAERDLPSVRIQTYDDILDRMTARLKHWGRCRE